MRCKPIIGIGGELITEDIKPVIGYEYEYTRNNYAIAIVENGGIPCYLPVTDDYSIIAEYGKMIDGLLIPGGLDVNPLFYKREPRPLLEVTIPRTDRFQIDLIREMLKERKPIFGSCRGCQILNVALGGTLYQDIIYAVDEPIQHNQRTQLEQVAHSVETRDNSILRELFGKELLVNSYHHQSVDTLGKGLRITAESPDGIVEGIQLDEAEFVIGVQWHPEMLLSGNSSMSPLFKRFIEVALKNC